MNKLIIDNDINVDQIIVDSDMDIYIDMNDVSKSINIQVTSGVCLRVIEKTFNTSNKFVYDLLGNCDVLVNKISVDCSDNVIVNLNDDNSSIKYNTSIINYKDNTFMQDIKHNSKNTVSKIINHCINVDDNEFKFVVNGIINRDCSGTKFKQDNKIINLKSGKSFIKPNLIVDNDDIEANHSAYIGSFDSDVKFYMMSRGLSENECNDLLIKSFLLSDMELEDKDRDIFIEIIEKINK